MKARNAERVYETTFENKRRPLGRRSEQLVKEVLRDEMPRHRNGFTVKVELCKVAFSQMLALDKSTELCSGSSEGARRPRRLRVGAGQELRPAKELTQSRVKRSFKRRVDPEQNDLSVR